MISVIFIVFFMLLLNIPCQESITARDLFNNLFMDDAGGVPLVAQDLVTVNLNLPEIPGGPADLMACYHLFHGFNNQDALGDFYTELAHCGVAQAPNVHKRSIGGATIPHREHPWMVVIKAKIRKRIVRITSGIIIHRRFILASTYGIPAEADTLSIIVGGASYDRAGRPITSRGVYSFTRDILRDRAVRYMPGNEPNGHEHRCLALIDLGDQSIQAYNDYVMPACIPAFLQPGNAQICDLMQGEVVTVAGYGSTALFNDHTTLNKQQMTVQEVAQLDQAVLLTSNEQNGGATISDYGAPIEVHRNLAVPGQQQQHIGRKFVLALITYVHPPTPPNPVDPDVIAINLVQAAPWITRTIQQMLEPNDYPQENYD